MKANNINLHILLFIMCIIKHEHNIYSSGISFAITTHNEGLILQQCLESLMKYKRVTDEIIILDDYSTDEITLKILEDASTDGAFIYKKRLEYDFSSHKNYLLSLCSKEWILNIDADEIIPPKLIKHIFEVTEEDNGYDLYTIPRSSFIVNYRDENLFSKPLSDDVYEKLLSGKAQNILSFVYPDHQARLCKNVPYIKYSRPIHESIAGSAKHTGTFPDDQMASIIHYSLYKDDNSKQSFYLDIYRNWLRSCINSGDNNIVALIFKECAEIFADPEFIFYKPSFNRFRKHDNQDLRYIYRLQSYVSLLKDSITNLAK